jgi:IS30 family transposase
MIGKNHKGRVLSIVDKASKYAIFIHLAQTSAKIVAHKICQALKPFAEKKGVCTLTSDNGKEFAAHELVKQLLPIEGFFFANPYASYERGLNEHTNGVFRQYFSKSTDFTKITQADLDKVADRINNRPRKSLKYQTPLEAMRRLLARRQSGALQC